MSASDVAVGTRSPKSARLWTAALVAGAVAAGLGVALLTTDRPQAPANAQALLDKAQPSRQADPVNRLSGTAPEAAHRAQQMVESRVLDQVDTSGAAVLSELGQFAPASPVFTLKIQAPNIDVALSSLQEIYAQLEPNDAQALDFAVRFLAVTRLRGGDFAIYGEDPAAIPDNALFQHILPIIDGRTPMQVMIDARNEQEKLRQARAEVPVDPFDRIEMERRNQGQLPGMSIPR